MQSLTVPTGDRNPNGRTATEVLSALQAPYGSRRFSFRYELLDLTNATVTEALHGVRAGEIEMNWLADIKRTAKFTILETGEIDYLSDRIRPHARLHLSPYGVDDFVEWPLGVFLLSTPRRHIDRHGVITREVSAYDQLQVYADDLITTRYTVAAGTNVVTTVTTLLGGVAASIAPSTATLAAAKEWDPGTSKLKIINELLGMINYESLSFDEDGQAVVQPYSAPSVRTEEYVYATDAAGLIVPEVDQELDLFAVPNQWTLVVSEPDQPAITSTYTNNDPGSPTSTVRRGRTISDFRIEVEAVDQATLDSKVERLAFEASQVYEAIDFVTALMPIHSGNDVYRIQYDPLAINHKYAEQTWTLPLRAGATMTHRARRVVTV
ncbi:MAG TPA: hypothetical protein VFP10_12425 [Candidatus Eisenbacteria bacterium]|nr:hypothetical protein [Candidatus Eisenbacteria bacterium]